MPRSEPVIMALLAGPWRSPGAVVRDKAFSTRQSWTVDIRAMAGGTKLALEYDGAYGHGATAKLLMDGRKSTDLLAVGYAVVRLREDDLPQLPIQHPRHKEIRVYSAAPHPRAVLKEIPAWLDEALTMDGSSNGFLTVTAPAG